MPSWNELLNTVRRADEAVLEYADRKRRIEEDGLSFDRALQQQTEQLFDELAERCASRAAWFKETSGHEVRLSSETQLMANRGRLHALQLQLESAKVQIYCQRRPFSAPQLHLLQAMPSLSDSRGSPRLVSFPGIKTRLDSEGKLQALSLLPENPSSPESPIEQLVFRAFELLVMAYAIRHLGHSHDETASETVAQPIRLPG